MLRSKRGARQSQQSRAPRPARPRGTLHYHKPTPELNELVYRRVDRGLIVLNRERALRYLRHITAATACRCTSSTSSKAARINSSMRTRPSTICPSNTSSTALSPAGHGCPRSRRSRCSPSTGESHFDDLRRPVMVHRCLAAPRSQLARRAAEDGESQLRQRPPRDTRRWRGLPGSSCGA